MARSTAARQLVPRTATCIRGGWGIINRSHGKETEVMSVHALWVRMVGIGVRWQVEIAGRGKMEMRWRWQVGVRWR